MLNVFFVIGKSKVVQLVDLVEIQMTFHRKMEAS